MWRTAGEYLFIGRDTTAGEDFSTRFISSLFISSVCTHCQRLFLSCYIEKLRAERKAAGHCHEALPCREREYLHPASVQCWGRSVRSKANRSPKPMKPRIQRQPYPGMIPLQRCLPRAWVSRLRCLPVLLPWGCHKGGAEVNGAKSRINLHVLICSCSQNLVVVWPFSKHRTLPSGGMYGGEERKVRVSK